MDALPDEHEHDECFHDLQRDARHAAKVAKPSRVRSQGVAQEKHYSQKCSFFIGVLCIIFIFIIFIIFFFFFLAGLLLLLLLLLDTVGVSRGRPEQPPGHVQPSAEGRVFFFCPTQQQQQQRWRQDEEEKDEKRRGGRRLCAQAA